MSSVKDEKKNVEENESISLADIEKVNPSSTIPRIRCLHFAL